MLPESDRTRGSLHPVQNPESARQLELTGRTLRPALSAPASGERFSQKHSHDFAIFSNPPLT